MARRQTVRHGTLAPVFAGSNPAALATTAKVYLPNPYRRRAV